MPPAIKVENLSKSYLVGHNSEQGEKYTALRDVVSRNVRNLARKTRDMLTGRQIVQGDEVEEFWALKDINFEIQPGDRVGIIGRNGAGKSTLLKILSRITEPTRGRVTIHGRVASLLEVGTGFHPELTGRENIFLNGAILGMSRKEIQRKFDEIVDFAEVEKFLDTPVKRYSSGMYVRLAFAVAAHLEPEILVVDEVLAVGDSQFQEKCMGKMEEASKEGRTVLFVSHNMGAIRTLCSKGVFLSKGSIQATGDVSAVIDKYLHVDKFKRSSTYSWDLDQAPGDERIRLRGVEVLQPGHVNGSFEDSKPLTIAMKVNASESVNDVTFSCMIECARFATVVHSESGLSGDNLTLQHGDNTLIFTLPCFVLRDGEYSITVCCTIPNIKIIFLEKDIVVINVRCKNPAIMRYPDVAWKGVLHQQMGSWGLQ